MIEKGPDSIRWKRWKAQEPLVDFMGVEETEIAEYRKWAGTKGWHERTVDELMEIADRSGHSE